MFSLIVCTDNQYGIGMNDGSIPFHNSSDLKNFKNLTIGHIVIMGRKTWDSLPKKPLPDRLNVIISTNQILDKNDNISNVLSFTSIEECLIAMSHKAFKNQKKFVIGGATIYNYFIEHNLIQDIYHTMVDADYHCDVKMIRYNDKGNFKESDNLLFSIVNDEIAFKANEHKWTYNVYNFINNEEIKFLNLLDDILHDGIYRADRTEVGTKALFGKFMEFDLSDNTFPLGTTKQVPLRQVFEELMWFLRGQTDANILANKGIYIWNGNTTREFLDKRGLTSYNVGAIGPTYGHSFRHYGAKYINSDTDYKTQGFDQLNEAIRLIKEDPYSRRIIINLWNPEAVDKCCLPPCLYCYQFFVEPAENGMGKLSCLMSQRSSDISLAGFWNIATGSLLTYLIARVTGLQPKTLKWSIGDAHIYNNQTDAVKKQLLRTPRVFPKLLFSDTAPSLENGRDITEFEFDDLQLVGYNPYPSIKSIMNV